MARTRRGSKADQVLSLALLLGSVATTGCRAPSTSPPSTGSPPLPVSAASPAFPASSKGKLSDAEPLIYRAVSTEGDETAVASPPSFPSAPLHGATWADADQEMVAPEASLQSSQASVPGALQNYPLNPVVDLMKGNGDSQTRQDALQTLGMAGLSGMVPLLHRFGNGSGGAQSWHRLGDVTEDLLQPDDGSTSGRPNRAPFTFGLEWKY